jgi:hypothetical protein
MRTGCVMVMRSLTAGVDMFLGVWKVYLLYQFERRPVRAARWIVSSGEGRFPERSKSAER